MRLRKTDLRGRVNGSLCLRFQTSGLSSYAGLELVRRYVRTLGFSERLRRTAGRRFPGTDFGVVGMLRLLLGLILVGGRRLQHLLYLEGDPVVLRFCGLRRLPSPRSVARWLSCFTRRQVEALLGLNSELVAEAIRSMKLRRLTIDVDGSIVSTGAKVLWAQRGFNPHHRKVRSYYPITAYEAQSGLILRVKNRPGNVHDGKAGVPFLRDVFRQIAETLGAGHLLEFRLDGAFFRQDVLELLDKRRAEYAIRVPFHPWLNLKPRVQANKTWTRVNATVSCFEIRHEIQPWNRRDRIVIYRKQVQHKTRKNFQLDLFDPADGHFEYSAIVTNKTLTGRSLWHFMCGRGTHEQAYGELRSGFAFDCVPSLSYGANSAWQVLSVLAFNLMRRFQAATTAPRRRRTRKRRTLYRYETIQTLRYECLHRAGIVCHPAGHATLDVGTSPAVKKRFTRIHEQLAQAA